MMILHVFLGALLLAIPAGALYYFDKALLRSFGVAVGRMVTQILLVSLIVWALVHYDKVWISLLWDHCSFLLGPGEHKVLLCSPRVSSAV